MTQELLADRMVKDLFKDDPLQGEVIGKKFEALSAFGEFGWRYLLKRIGKLQSYESTGDPNHYLKELAKTMVEKQEQYKKIVDTYVAREAPFGAVLQKAMEGLSPLSPLEKEVLEFTLKWIALEKVLAALNRQESMADIAQNLHVSEKWVRETYYDFTEVVVSDYLGDDLYQILPQDDQEYLKNLFLHVINREKSLQEFAFFVKGLQIQLLKRIRRFNIGDLQALSLEQARHALKACLESGVDFPEKELIAWANEKGFDQVEIERLLELRPHH